ncbi:hypothetical protein PR048_030746 [Dryococelus australis]|uniref:Uncharacterized protein n=1 Tax=Dryococelus australis TaxID=614101 RepID=A0ABQ9GDL9_9NEOP|nr:hypothetical protein PR048_030746 [Dryococelus australis]
MELGTQINKPFMDFIINELSSRLPKSELQRVGQIKKLMSPEFSDGFENKVLRVWKQIWKSDPSQKFPKPPAEGYKLASALTNISYVSTLMCPTGYNTTLRHL